LFTDGRIACGSEIDCYSDQRLKENVRNITDIESISFVKNVQPKYYNLKKDKAHSYGYLAQDICKAELTHSKDLQSLITLHQTQEIDEHIDNDGFTSPKDHIMAINYNKICCLLHKYILIQDEKIKINEEIIEDLQEQIKNMKQKNEDDINEIKELLNLKANSRKKR
jgi:hypothetical protein